MPTRVTVQDIADALGVSRNTVSKAINGTGVLAEATRQKILLKAAEMGYKQFSYMKLPAFSTGNNDSGDGKTNGNTAEKPFGNYGVISLLTTGNLGSSHFSSTMLDRFQRELSERGYSFMIHRVTEEDIREMRLPSSFRPELAAAVMCIELFHSAYAEMLCGMGLPILFVDGPVSRFGKRLACDFLIMDNRTEIIAFIAEMTRRGYTKFGFVGEVHHCISFYERYLSLKIGLSLYGLSLDEKYVISSGNEKDIYADEQAYQEFLQYSLKDTDLPEVFFCANDFIALDVLAVFRQKGVRVPEDVLLCGFDDSPESRVVTPSLTTIHIHTQIMGLSAANLLVSRIQEPTLHYRTVYTETSIIYRESTKDS